MNHATTRIEYGTYRKLKWMLTLKMFFILLCLETALFLKLILRRQKYKIYSWNNYFIITLDNHESQHHLH